MFTEKERYLMQQAFSWGFDHGMNDENNGYSSMNLTDVFNDLLEETVADCGITCEMVLSSQVDDKFNDHKDT